MHAVVRWVSERCGTSLALIWHRYPKHCGLIHDTMCLFFCNDLFGTFKVRAVFVSDSPSIPQEQHAQLLYLVSVDNLAARVDAHNSCMDLAHL